MWPKSNFGPNPTGMGPDRANSTSHLANFLYTFESSIVKGPVLLFATSQTICFFF